jgi:hypothetical protein
MSSKGRWSLSKALAAHCSVASEWNGGLGAHLFGVACGIQAERSSRHSPLDQDQRFPHSAKPALRIGKGQTTDGDGDEYRKGYCDA